jgi:hypothetical protein
MNQEEGERKKSVLAVGCTDYTIFKWLPDIFYINIAQALNVNFIYNSS